MSQRKSCVSCLGSTTRGAHCSPASLGLVHSSRCCCCCCEDAKATLRDSLEDEPELSSRSDSSSDAWLLPLSEMGGVVDALVLAVVPGPRTAVEDDEEGPP